MFIVLVWILLILTHCYLKSTVSGFGWQFWQAEWHIFTFFFQQPFNNPFLNRVQLRIHVLLFSCPPNFPMVMFEFLTVLALKLQFWQVKWLDLTVYLRNLHSLALKLHSVFASNFPIFLYILTNVTKFWEFWSENY